MGMGLLRQVTAVWRPP